MTFWRNPGNPGKGVSLFSLLFRNMATYNSHTFIFGVNMFLGSNKDHRDKMTSSIILDFFGKLQFLYYYCKMRAKSKE